MFKMLYKAKKKHAPDCKKKTLNVFNTENNLRSYNNT